jgi:hypothetical protein
MPPTGFEPAIPATKRPQNYALKMRFEALAIHIQGTFTRLDLFRWAYVFYGFHNAG